MDWAKLYTMSKFTTTGIIATIVFYLFYTGIYTFLWCVVELPETYIYNATVAWVVSYLLSISFQHFMQRNLVFTDKDGNPTDNNSYIKSLLMTYVAYMIGLVFSAFLNEYFIYKMGINITVSWAMTLIITGFINYAAVKKIMGQKETIDPPERENSSKNIDTHTKPKGTNAPEKRNNANNKNIDVLVD